MRLFRRIQCLPSSARITKNASNFGWCCCFFRLLPTYVSLIENWHDPKQLWITRTNIQEDREKEWNENRLHNIWFSFLRLLAFRRKVPPSENSAKGIFFLKFNCCWPQQKCCASFVRFTTPTTNTKRCSIAYEESSTNEKKKTNCKHIINLIPSSSPKYTNAEQQRLRKMCCWFVISVSMWCSCFQISSTIR